jgi:hypothetical protein
MTRTETAGRALSSEELRLIDAYWRAANGDWTWPAGSATRHEPSRGAPS